MTEKTKQIAPNLLKIKIAEQNRHPVLKVESAQAVDITHVNKRQMSTGLNITNFIFGEAVIKREGSLENLHRDGRWNTFRSCSLALQQPNSVKFDLHIGEIGKKVKLLTQHAPMRHLSRIPLCGSCPGFGTLYIQRVYREWPKGRPWVVRNFSIALPGCCKAKLVRVLAHLFAILNYISDIASVLR